MRLFLRLEDEKKSCVIWVVYLLRVTLLLKKSARMYMWSWPCEVTLNIWKMLTIELLLNNGWFV